MRSLTQFCKKWKILLCLALNLINVEVFAIVMPNVYEAILDVDSQDEGERKQLFNQGLLQVLQRISAGRATENQDAVQTAMKNIIQYVDQYTYDENNQLLIKYNAELINQLIRHSGQISWGQNRPSVVLWLAIEENQHRRLVGSENEPELQLKIQQMAQALGLPLLLPLMDLQDMTAVTTVDVWGQFSSVLQDASKRYQAQGILVGRVIHHAENENQWESHWQLLNDTRVENATWSVQGQDLNEVLTKGLSGTTRFMMEKYGVTNQTITEQNTTSHKPLLVGVKDIQTQSDFARVEAYFLSLEQVNRVSVNQVSSDLAIFEIIPKINNQYALEQAISLDQHLVALNEEQSSLTDLWYRFVP